MTRKQEMIKELDILMSWFSMDAQTVGTRIRGLHDLGGDFTSLEFDAFIVPLTEALAKQDQINKLLLALLQNG